MGLYDSRDWPGFQHSLAESLEELLLVIQLENCSYVGRRVGHVNGSLLCEPSMGSLLNSLAQNRNENEIAPGLCRQGVKNTYFPLRVIVFASGCC